MGLGGLLKKACLTSSARRAAPLAARCKPGTPLERSIYGDDTSHSGLHLPWTRRRPPRAPFYSTLSVGQVYPSAEVAEVRRVNVRTLHPKTSVKRRTGFGAGEADDRGMAPDVPTPRVRFVVGKYAVTDILPPGYPRGLLALVRIDFPFAAPVCIARYLIARYLIAPYHRTLPPNGPPNLFDRFGPARAQKWWQHDSRPLPDE